HLLRVCYCSFCLRLLFFASLAHQHDRDSVPMLIDRLLDTGAARVTEFRTADGALHDRSQTVGGSENHTCIRRLWFAKRGTAPDPGYRDNWGFFQRGHTVEDWLVGLITDALPEGYRLLYTGKDQRTLVSGRLSATPDGLLVTGDAGIAS